MRLAAILLAIAVMALGHGAVSVGASFAAAEVNRIPAALLAVALLVLWRGPGALPAATGWAVLGAAAAVPLRALTGFPTAGGAIPGEVTSLAEALCDIAWLIVIAALAWWGGVRNVAGPLVAIVVATTRIGRYGQALVPVLWEDTALDALRMGVGVGAGFIAGIIVLLVSGWAVSIVARVPERWLRPGRALSALAAAAALGHMLLV